jgi:hypothetical protein
MNSLPIHQTQKCLSRYRVGWVNPSRGKVGIRLRTQIWLIMKVKIDRENSQFDPLMP